MMHKDLFSDGISRIDPDEVERLLQIEQALERRAAGRWRGRVLTILAAAVLTVALLAASTLALIPFIPKTYDLNYEIPKHQLASTVVRVYYTDENGNAQSERVKIPGDTEANVFLTWQHLNAVDEQVQLLDYTVTTEPMASTQVVPGTLWEFLAQQLGKRDEQTVVTATLSAGITAYENQDALIDSLIQTIAKYAGVSPEQVRILIDGETIAIIGPLQFWHNLQGGGDVIIGTGSTLEITVGMTNISDQPIYYTGSSSAFVPDATLRLGNTVIEHEIYPHTEDEVELTLAPGESREVTYRFTIPTDAPAGAYDLTVTYKGQSMTIGHVVEVVVMTHTSVAYIPEWFGTFLDEYGFTTADWSVFQHSVQKLTYQGTNVFDLMNEVEADAYPGYTHPMIMWGDQFRCESSTFRVDSTVLCSKNQFTATVLPDGMTLLCGECHSDTLTGALEALGYHAQAAQELLAQKAGVTLATDDGYYLSLTYNNGRYTLAYCDVVFLDGSAVLRQMQLRYDEQTQAFLNLYISTSASGYSIPAAITRTNQGVYVNWHLNDLQSLRLLEIVNTGSWALDTPIYTDFTLSPIINLGGNTIMFEEGWLIDAGCYITPSDTQKAFIRSLFDLFTLYEGNVAFQFAISDDGLALVELDEQQAQAVLEMLNRGEWKQGVLELECDTYCSAGNSSLKYDSFSGIFINGDKYLNLSKENADYINAILAPYRDMTTNTSFDSDTLFDYDMQYKPTYEDYLQIQEGMTVEEVVEILGKPHYSDTAVGSKYFCWETADGASCAIKVASPHATEGWSDWADILQPNYGGATVVHCNYYGTVPDEGGK